MIRIAQLAKKRPAIARLLIAVLHLFIIGCCYLLCQQLRALDVQLPAFTILLIAFAGFALVAILKKPVNNIARGPKKKWWLQRLRFFVMICSCNLLMISYFSSTSTINFSYEAKAVFTKKVSALRPQASEYENQVDYANALANYYKKLPAKELRKTLRHDLKKLDKNNENFGHIVLVVLFVLVIFFASLTIVILSCILLCTGYGLLALLSFVGGSGIIVGLALLFNHFEKKRKSRLQARKKAIQPAGNS